MYRMFCHSLKNYLSINNFQESSDEFRYQIAKALKILADVSLYQNLKKSSGSEVVEIENLIYHLSINYDRFPRFKAFAWELDGYGFNSLECEGFSTEVIEEQLKLIDILLSCQYWSVA